MVRIASHPFCKLSMPSPFAPFLFGPSFVSLLPLFFPFSSPAAPLSAGFPRLPRFSSFPFTRGVSHVPFPRFAVFQRYPPPALPVSRSIFLFIFRCAQRLRRYDGTGRNGRIAKTEWITTRADDGLLGPRWGWSWKEDRV